MREWTIKQIDTEEIAVLLFPRFSNHCLANAIEPLRAANEILQYEAYRWRFATLDGNAVQSSSGLPVLPDCRLHDLAGGAYLFVLSSYDVRDFARATTAKALQAASKRFKNIVGMDTGAWLMAQAGLLDGRKATIHWVEFTGFSERFTQIETITDRYVQDDDRLTCGGATTAFDLVLDMIRRRHGEALGLEVAAFFLHWSADMPQNRLYRQQTSPTVARCIAIMTSHLETPLPISQIARQVGISQRTLSRIFVAETGATPTKVYQRLRLSAARRYAEQSRYSVSEIALRCGYTNPAAMTRAFATQYGKPPSSFRP